MVTKVEPQVVAVQIQTFLREELYLLKQPVLYCKRLGRANASQAGCCLAVFDLIWYHGVAVSGNPEAQSESLPGRQPCVARERKGSGRSGSSRFPGIRLNRMGANNRQHSLTGRLSAYLGAGVAGSA
jgi:hypothetical protein